MDQKFKYCWVIAAILLPLTTEASHHCSQWLAKVISIQGEAHAQYPGDNAWHTLSPDIEFCHGDKVRTKKHSRVTLLFSNQSRATLDQSSTLILMAPEQKKSSWYIDLIKGTSFFRSRQPHRLDIRTPFINAVHEGTEFIVSVNSDHAEISVIDGQVDANNSLGNIKITKGYTGVALQNQAPSLKPLTIKPQDAVQWALYYPPIIDIQTYTSVAITELKQAIEAYKTGNSYQSLLLLDKVPIAQQDNSYHALKASLLLTTGSVTSANNEIEKILHSDQNNSIALALKAIIAVTKNRTDKALNLARTAINYNPQSAVAHIAMSYVYQSKFKIELALEATQKAIKLSPDNALAWARLSELQLSTGERAEALASAEKALTLNPKLDRIQTVLGFNHLAQVDIALAKKAFIQAINLNSGDPLAYLGLGLAKIRKGNVEEGTHDIETAVSLDPDNAIMRSYLGKAYYELRNDDYAATELDLAKEMDPNDPTPWFYDAIRKQTANRPVEALHDMEKAIELNNNKGIYRSKLLLDKDLAARSASLGRIYSDLNFQQLGLLEGWKSLSIDPSNYSAHRLLADNYNKFQRNEIARVSELLQSQLLQPINITPIQPQLAESNLLLQNGFGPSTPSFNEFNPLFSTNRFTLQTSGIYGGNNTLGDEIVHSGLWNKFSYSLGQFHYETDGFRENNHLESDIYNVFAQLSLPFDTDLQLEYRNSKAKSGDLALKFNKNDFSKNLIKTTDTQIFRLGLHHKLNSNHNFLASAIYSKRESTEQDSFQISDFDGFFTTNVATSFNTLVETQSYSVELQSLHKFEQLNFIFGLGHYNQNEIFKRTNKTVTDITSLFFSLHDESITPSIKDRDAKHNNAYLYSKLFLKENLIFTLGVSLDSLDSKSLGKLEKVNPKFGLEWGILPNTTIRAAYFETMKRPLNANQTIEPTQVAGIIQNYDDINGTDTSTYGFAIDHKFSPKVYFGGESKWRDIKTPISNSSKKNQHEQLHHAYFNWTPNDKTAINIEYNYERINREPTTTSDLLATKLITHQVPIDLSFFLPNGLFSGISATYFNHEIEKINTNLRNRDNFWILDTEIGYRLPNKWGIFKLGIENFLNNKAHFESFNLPSATDSQPSLLFSPERVFYTNFTFSFN